MPYSNYVSYVFTPPVKGWEATGCTYVVSEQKGMKVRFQIWQGGVNWQGEVKDDDVLVVALWGTQIDFTSDDGYRETVGAGKPPHSPEWQKLGSRRLKKRNEYLLSPWFAVPEGFNLLGLYVQGNGRASFYPQEQAIELIRDLP